MDDTVTFTDAKVTAAITLADEEIDRYCFTSFEYKAFIATLSGQARRSIAVKTDEGFPILYLRSLTSVTIDGVSQVTTNWKLYPEGLIVRDSGTFDWERTGRNVVVIGTAGMEENPPAQIKWASRKLARFHLLNDVNRTEDRALSMSTDFGNIMLSHASNNADRPTALPEVNARIAKFRQQSGSAFI